MIDEQGVGVAVGAVVGPVVGVRVGVVPLPRDGLPPGGTPTVPLGIVTVTSTGTMPPSHVTSIVAL